MKRIIGLIISCFVLCTFSSCEKEVSSTVLRLMLQKENTTVKQIKILDSRNFTTCVNFYEEGIDITKSKIFTFTNCFDTIIRIEIFTDDDGFFRSKKLKVNPHWINYVEIYGDSLNFEYYKK